MNDFDDDGRITRSTGFDASLVWFNSVKETLTPVAKHAYLCRVLAPMARPAYKGLHILLTSFFKVKQFKLVDFPVFCIKIVMPHSYKKLSSMYVKLRGKSLN